MSNSTIQLIILVLAGITCAMSVILVCNMPEKQSDFDSTCVENRHIKPSLLSCVKSDRFLLKERARTNTSAFALLPEDLQHYFKSNREDVIILNFFGDWVALNNYHIFPDTICRIK